MTNLVRLLFFLQLEKMFLCSEYKLGQKEELLQKFDDEPHKKLDHKIVLGSEKLANEFDELSSEESKRRLKILAEKNIDINRDGFITKQELQNWVFKNLIALDKEETENRYKEIDTDNNGITWNEYLLDAFGVDLNTNINQLVDDNFEDRKLMEEDEKYFKAADVNQDNVLTLKEFYAFQNPEQYSHMHETLIINTLIDKDIDKDGKINLKEFMGETYNQPNSEWYVTEKLRFTEEYDADKNGFLEGEELKHWLIFDIQKTALQETEHLINTADKNSDGKLSIEEVVNSYKTFVGSEATSFGEKLLNFIHEEL